MNSQAKEGIIVQGWFEEGMSRYELTETIADLLDTEVRERGVNAMLLCPFHDEDSPSFSIHLNEGLWHCFGCGKKGNLEKLFRLLGEEMTDERRQDALIRGLHRTPTVRRNFAAIANAHLRDVKGVLGRQALRSYLDTRPICACFEIPFGVGYSREKQALSFPYWDDDGGTATGIKYRGRDGFKWSEDDSEFGIYAVELARGKPAVVVFEGESDTHAGWSELRYSTKLGICGISGSKHDVKTWELWALDFLFSRRVYLALDADEAGDEGFALAQEALGDKAIRLRPPEGLDISEHIKQGGTVRELGLDSADLELQTPAPDRILSASRSEGD